MSPKQTEAGWSILGVLFLVALVVFVLIWPVEVVVKNIHNVVWDWVAGVPSELLWLAVVIAVVRAAVKANKRRPAQPPAKRNTEPRTNTSQSNITVIVQQPPPVPCKYCGAASRGRCQYCGAPS